MNNKDIQNDLAVIRGAIYLLDSKPVSVDKEMDRLTRLKKNAESSRHSAFFLEGKTTGKDLGALSKALDKKGGGLFKGNPDILDDLNQIVSNSCKEIAAFKDELPHTGKLPLIPYMIECIDAVETRLGAQLREIDKNLVGANEQDTKWLKTQKSVLLGMPIEAYMDTFVKNENLASDAYKSFSDTDWGLYSVAEINQLRNDLCSYMEDTLQNAIENTPWKRKKESIQLQADYLHRLMTKTMLKIENRTIEKSLDPALESMCNEKWLQYDLNMKNIPTTCPEEEKIKSEYRKHLFQKLKRLAMHAFGIPAIMDYELQNFNSVEEFEKHLDECRWNREYLEHVIASNEAYYQKMFDSDKKRYEAMLAHRNEMWLHSYRANHQLQNFPDPKQELNTKLIELRRERDTYSPDVPHHLHDPHDPDDHDPTPPGGGAALPIPKKKNDNQKHMEQRCRNSRGYESGGGRGRG